MVGPIVRGPGWRALAGLWRRWTGRADGATMPGVATGPKRLLTIPDVARMLGVTPDAIADRVRRGTLRPHFVANYGKGVAYLFDADRLASELSTREGRLIHRD